MDNGMEWDWIRPLTAGMAPENAKTPIAAVIAPQP